MADIELTPRLSVSVDGRIIVRVTSPDLMGESTIRWSREESLRVARLILRGQDDEDLPVLVPPALPPVEGRRGAVDPASLVGAEVVGWMGWGGFEGGRGGG